MIGMFELAEINSLGFYTLFGGVERDNDKYYLRIKDSNGDIYWEKEFKTDLALARYLYFSDMSGAIRLFKNLFALIKVYLEHIYGDAFHKDTEDVLIYNIKSLLSDLDKDLPFNTIEEKIQYLKTSLQGKTTEDLIKYIIQVYPTINTESKG